MGPFLGNPGRIVSAAGTDVYTYDARSRLEQVTYREGEPAQSVESFGYDRVGNRVSHTRDGVTRTYVVDAADRLLSTQESSATGPQWVLPPTQQSGYADRVRVSE